MTLEDFYKDINGDYADILSRLSEDEIILHFIKRFKSDGTYIQLMDAVEKADASAGFTYAHKLKGIAANLSFSELHEALSVLTRQLKGQQTPPANKESVERVSECYHRVMSEINCLEEGGWK